MRDLYLLENMVHTSSDVSKGDCVSNVVKTAYVMTKSTFRQVPLHNRTEPN